MIIKNTFGNKTFGNLLTMLANKKFRDEVIAVRDKYGIPESGIDDEYHKKHGKHAEAGCFAELEQLRAKYKLNSLYGHFLMDIILFAKIPDDNILNNSKPFELFHYKENSGLECAAIKIYPETSITDIQKNWKDIQKFSKETYGYKIRNQRTSKNYLRDLYLRSIKRWGFTNKENAKTINAVFPRLSTIGYDSVPKIIEKNKRKASQLLKRGNKNR